MEFNRPNNDKPPETDDEKKLCGWVKSKVEDVRGNGTRISHEGVWMTNIAYLMGFSGSYWDSSTREFRAVGSKDKGLRRNRIHVNKVLPTIQNRLSRLSKNRPKYQVRPNSNDSEDRDAARLSQQILDMVWEKEKMSKKYLDLLMWNQQCGHGYLKVTWDETKGELLEDPMTGQVEYEGGIRIDVVSAFEMFPDPLAKTLEEAQYIIQAKVRKLDYFRLHYPGKGDEVKEEGAWLLSAQYEGRINTLNTRGPTGSSWTQQMKDAAIELSYYEKPSRKHPRGRMIICANGVLLEQKELPCGVIPFIKFDDIAVSGKYYSESVITHLRPIQDQYNRVITKRSQWVNTLLAGKYLVARGSNISAEALNDQSGEVLEYSPVPNAAPPQAMTVPNIPSFAYEEEVSLEKQFSDISGINEASRGQAPSGITAGISLAFLSEQDDTRIGIMSRRNELDLAEFFGLVLKYIGEYCKTPQLLKIAGHNQTYQVKNFKGADLKGNYDVQVIEGSTLPGSTTAKRDYILTYWKAGVLGDPTNPEVQEKVAKMLEFGDISDIWEDQGLDMNQSVQEINSIKAGQMPEISEFDNHVLILKELNKFRKSNFSNLDMDKQQMLLELMERHLDEIVNKQLPPDQQQALKEMPSLDMMQAQAEGQVPPEMMGVDPNSMQGM